MEGNQNSELDMKYIKNEKGHNTMYPDNEEILVIVTKTVSNLTGVTMDEMKARYSPRRISEARQIAMKISYDSGKVTERFIGKFFGGRHHSTVDFARKQVSNLYDTDNYFRNKIDNLNEMLKNDAQYNENLETFKQVQTEQ